MNHDDSSWRDHRDELLERVVHAGRARKRRRGLGVMSVALAVVLAVAAGVYIPNRDNHSLHVANNVAPATTVPPARAGNVLLIGDEVMLGARAALQDTIAGAHVDARVSRQFRDAIPLLDAFKRGIGLPPTIVIHLGTNGAFTQPQFQQLMDTVGSEPQVYFLTVKVPRTWEAEVNSSLDSATWQYPNAHVLAWHDFSKSHTDWFLADGIHLTPAGQTAYAEFLRDGIRPPVTAYADPFAGGVIPTTGLVLTDDGKTAGEREAPTFTMKLFDDSGKELGALPRGAIDNNVSNFVRHKLVVTDTGIHLESVPLESAGDLPNGCVPTEKVQALAVALCGEVNGGFQVIGHRILVNNGSGWSELIVSPPVPAGGDLVGHWAWAEPSPDGRWVAAGWSGACETPTGFFVSVADGSVHTVTGEAGVAWWGSPNSGIIGWRADGLAMGAFGGEAACGTSAPAQRGIYLVSPDDVGSRDLLLPLTPSQGAFRWTSVDDQRTATNRSGADGEITYAYGHFFDPALTADQRAALIEDGDALRAFIDRSFARHAGEAAAGAIVVDDITVHGSTADVSFRAFYLGAESPANPGHINGTAVLEDDTWKISRATYCALSANDGETCPPRFEDALSDLGVNLDAAPGAVKNLASLEFCGFERFQGFSRPESLNVPARRCFLDRSGSGVPAVFVMAQTSTEGDPIVTIYRSTTERHVEVFVDATRDAFGSGKWEYGTCGGVTTEFPNAPSPLPTYYFDGKDCGPVQPYPG